MKVPPLPVAPVIVTQRNVEAAFGLPERRFRELIAEKRIPHKRIGKLVCVRASDLLEALAAEAEEQPDEPPSNLARLRAVAGIGGAR